MQSAHSPSTKATKRGNRWIIPGAILAFVVLFAAIFAIHTSSAASAVKTFNDDYFSYRYDAAYNLVCADKQDALQGAFHAAQVRLDQSRGHVVFDTSGVNYDLMNLGLTTATIHEHGISKYSGDVAASINVDDNVTLKASGLGWCLTSLPDNIV